MSTTQAGHVLDNPCWYALNSHHARFASGNDLVKGYPVDMAPVHALVDYTEAAFAAFEQVTKDVENTSVFGANPPRIAGWTIHDVWTFPQYVCQQRVPQVETNAKIVELDKSDVPDIMALLDLGAHLPFSPRAIEMGHFIGIRQQGQLVAMAGQRFHLTGYCEISTVCTHPDWQGKGYARMLVSSLINDIWDNGEIPFLHVGADNTVAIRLYESLNFRKRCTMTIHIIGRS